ncbi:MAG: CDF family Co(II)/Ni(II) efflux transporter DmeF [Rhodospirillales bacterium]|nr:CDF family Co(II)/Ni(II) efflux transporter DmeF [Rhodospirillales bacterium]
MNNNNNLEFPRHSHSFGQEHVRDGERRTIIVIVITAVMMVVEIAAGLAFGSMALLADGLHMASHTVAIGITAFAYVYARKRAFDPRFSFGTGKVNALAGFGSAILLVVFAAFMAWESTERFFNPVEIAFNQAIIVAIVGLAVNAASALILGHSGEHEEHGHSHGHGHQHDHNLKAAYLHVIADALTSIFAIFALLAGKYFGLNWLDPLMGIVGAVLISKWSVGLIRDTAHVLLDHQAPEDVCREITAAIEAADGGASVSDLHVWSIGPGIRAAAISIVSNTPKSPSYYKELLPTDVGLEHITIEVHQRLITENGLKGDG